MAGRLHVVNSMNLMSVGNKEESNVIFQLNEVDADCVDLHPGIDVVTSDIDSDVYVMSLSDFKEHILRGMAFLSERDSLFSDLLNCDSADVDEEEATQVGSESEIG
jgi:hypothetical protein